MQGDPRNTGRLQRAPEGFIDKSGVRTVFAEAGRAGATAAPSPPPWPVPPARRGAVQPGAGRRRRPQHPRSARAQQGPRPAGGHRRLRQALEVRGQRAAPPQPGLTQTAQASVSFAPLQSLFGIVTPAGLHFERHHQGWWDIDPQAPADAQRSDAIAAEEGHGLHHGRDHAAALGVALPLHRVRRQHRHGVGQRRGADGAVHATA